MEFDRENTESMTRRWKALFREIVVQLIDCCDVMTMPAVPSEPTMRLSDKYFVKDDIKLVKYSWY